MGAGDMFACIIPLCVAFHPGVVDIRGRRDFSRFDPSPGEAPL